MNNKNLIRGNNLVALKFYFLQIIMIPAISTRETLGAQHSSYLCSSLTTDTRRWCNILARQKISSVR